MASTPPNSSSSEKNALKRLKSYEEALNREWNEFCEYVERQGPNGKWVAENILQRLVVNAPVTLGFAVICLCVHVLTLGGSATSISRILAVHDYWDGLSIAQYTSFWTHCFAHSSFRHLHGNLTMLMLVGPGVEFHFRSKNVLWIMTVVSLVSAMAHIVIGKQNTHQLGASGIVFAFILLNSMVSATQGQIPVSFVLTVLLYMGEEFWLLLASKDDVSHHAHLTGGLVGAAAGFYIHGTMQKQKQLVGKKTKSKTSTGIASLLEGGTKKKR
mmetsp:Transcript_9773/g.12900  ORF Transcript_9773/g.12900 Transcript_9773/m.12900 type:complete len:271 (-) Transcript_9773:411-1223(-)